MKKKRISSLILILFLLLFLVAAAKKIEAACPQGCYTPSQQMVGWCEIGTKTGCENYGDRWWCFNCGRGLGCYEECTSGYKSECGIGGGERCCCPIAPPAPCGNCIPSACAVKVGALPLEGVASEQNIPSRNYLQKNDSGSIAFAASKIDSRNTSLQEKDSFPFFISIFKWKKEVLQAPRIFISNLLASFYRFIHQ